MSPELQAVFHGLLTEAMELHRDAGTEFCARVRCHILDRWYRFEAFGVTSHKQLEPITVEAGVIPFEQAALPEGADPTIAEAWGSLKPVRQTTVRVNGTPLEAR
jgi:hypothetical protein